ncbi:MAG: 2-phospho-L-lactate guanylyltransferase [Methanomicrobiales archaeon]|nr:2-phospho-L-lactate guanylyltransferase [Methanomicrobiales archaeon]
MALDAFIPFKPVNPKTRLGMLLNQQEREEFALAMLRDVVAAVDGAGCDTVLLCTSPLCSFGKARVQVDARGLNEALTPLFQEHPAPLLLLMSDLPLVTAASVRRMITSGRDIVIAPGRGGGTNALFLQYPPRFRADFYGASFLKHCRIAEQSGCSWEIGDSFRISTDVDEKEDLVEVLIHGGRNSREFLTAGGFVLTVENGRVGVERNSHK